jgi:heme/copper-type cytochrome/quinol oxidase subunit 3
LVLGVLFLVAQALLWRRLAVAGWIPERGPTVMLFWALTGLHALHVLVGLATLVRVLRRRELTSRQALPQRLLPLGATYWHFLGVLWAVLFLVLFYGR